MDFLVLRTKPKQTLRKECLVMQETVRFSACFGQTISRILKNIFNWFCQWIIYFKWKLWNISIFFAIVFFYYGWCLAQNRHTLEAMWERTGVFMPNILSGILCHSSHKWEIFISLRCKAQSTTVLRCTQFNLLVQYT